MNVEVNYISVLVAGVGAMLAGALWYVAFGKALSRIRPLTPAQAAQIQKDSKKMYPIGFLLSLLTAYVLFYLMVMAKDFYGWGAVHAGVVSAFWAYLGIAMPVQAAHILFGNYGPLSQKIKLFGINTGAQLLTMLVTGLVLGIMN